jgi:hypothetical protein
MTDFNTEPSDEFKRLKTANDAARAAADAFWAKHPRTADGELPHLTPADHAECDAVMAAFWAARHALARTPEQK